MKITFLYIFAALCWGLSYLAIGVMVHQLPPFMSGALRLSVASVFFLVFLLLTKKKLKLNLSQFFRVVILSTVLQALPFSLLFWGEQHIQPALAGILVSSVAIFVVLFSIIIRHEQEGILLKSTGIIIGFLGILVIFSPLLSVGNIKITGGVFAVLGTAISYAIGNILLRKWIVSIDRWTNLTLQGVVSSSVLWIISFSFEQIPPLTTLILNPELLIALMYLGIFSSGLAWIASFYLIERMGSIRFSTICYPMALVSILADVFYYKKPPTSETIIGTLLIFLGVFVVQFTPYFLKRLKEEYPKSPLPLP